jgi:hypothetical protein
MYVTSNNKGMAKIPIGSFAMVSSNDEDYKAGEEDVKKPSVVVDCVAVAQDGQLWEEMLDKLRLYKQVNQHVNVLWVSTY